MTTRELINSSVSEAMIYILFGLLGPVMSSLQSKFYGLTSFSQLAGSISYILPIQSCHASCQCSLEGLNGEVHQCMSELQWECATKHWHHNICKRVITMWITVSNTISLPLLQLRRTQLQSQYGRDVPIFHSSFCKRLFAKLRRVYSNIQR